MTHVCVLALSALLATGGDVKEPVAGASASTSPAEATVAEATAAPEAPPAETSGATEATPAETSATPETPPAETSSAPEAKAPPEEEPPPPLHIFGDLGGDFVHLFSWENGAVLAGGGGFAWAVHSHDVEWQDAFEDSEFLRKAAKPGEVIGSLYFQLGVATSFYVFGKIGDKPKVAHIGWDLIRGQIVSQVLTQSLKYAVNRERPDGDKYSFPSGHASTTFATASILHQHFGWKVGIPSYTIASYVAMSRLPSNRHYLSDVIFGSAIGIVAGRTVTKHERARKVRVAPIATGMGAGLVVAVPFG